MLVRTPDYYGEFRCLAGNCPHTCCERWEVALDEETVRRYRTVSGPLGERLRAAMARDGEGAWCFPLAGGRCPFLDRENLCEIHRWLGRAATSVTCREHPRFTEDYGPFREITLAASCPAAGALLLGSRAPLGFRETVTAEPEEPGDAWLAWLVPLRAGLLDLLRDRRRPLRLRLADFLRCAAAAQALLEAERLEELPRLAEEPSRWRDLAAGDAPPLLDAALPFLASLEALEPDWRDLLARAAGAPGAPVPEALLERIAVYFAFRHLLKAVNDGDLLGRAQLCVLAVLTVERLAAVCGLEEALRRFCCEVEHSGENLEALRAAAWEEPLSWRASLCELLQ